MDDDKEKSFVEKMVDKINDVVENLATTASDAVQFAMEPNPKPEPEQVARTANEQVYIPEAIDPAPLILSKPAVEKRKVPVRLAPSKMPPKKAAAKKANKRSSKKSATKSAKKPAKKSLAKKSKKAAKKNAKKITKKRPLRKRRRNAKHAR